MANKVSKAAKNESDFNYDSKFAFYDFYRGFKKFKRMSIGSKYDEINDFYTLLNAFVNTHEATTTETKIVKIEFWIMPINFTMIILIFTKRNYNSTNVRKEEKRGRDYKRFEIINNRGQEPKSIKKEDTETRKTLMKYKNHYGLNQIKMILTH